MKLRLRFSKDGYARYIGHLDLMRYFAKALRRAKIDITYSAGFHPHPVFSIALPMPLGMSSEGEYADIGINSMKSAKSLVDALNRQMAEGISIIDCVALQDEGRRSSAMAQTSAALYRISAGDGSIAAAAKRHLSLLLEKESLVIEKKTKRSMEQIDIRGLLWDVSFEDDGIRMLLPAGSALNLKPSTVLEALAQSMGITLLHDTFHVRRLEIYSGECPDLRALIEYGTRIE